MIHDFETEREHMVKLDFKKGDGIMPAIAQDHKSGRVLMLAGESSGIKGQLQVISR